MGGLGALSLLAMGTMAGGEVLAASPDKGKSVQATKLPKGKKVDFHSHAILPSYVNGMKDYVLFYLDNEPKALITHLTMKAVEDMLPKDRFLRIHRSYIIAVDKIQKVDRNDCVYIGKEIIHIPDGYLQTFRQFLDTRVISKEK